MYSNKTYTVPGYNHYRNTSTSYISDFFHYGYSNGNSFLYSIPELKSDFKENITNIINWYHPEDNFRRIKDFWYECINKEGSLLHVCFPVELIRYRTECKNYFNKMIVTEQKQIKQRIFTSDNTNWSPSISATNNYNIVDHSHILQAISNSITNIFGCYGVDGIEFDKNEKLIYKGYCNRCNKKLPKGVLMYLKLQYGIKFK